MTARSRTSWTRLAALLDLLEVIEEAGSSVPREEAARLRREVARIVHVNGGIDFTKIDFDDPAGGGLAEHAFEVLARELIPKDPCWKPLIEDIKSSHPHGPARPR